MVYVKVSQTVVPDPSVGRDPQLNKMGREKKKKEKKTRNCEYSEELCIDNHNYCTVLINRRWFSLISPMTMQSLQINHNSTYYECVTQNGCYRSQNNLKVLSQTIDILSLVLNRYSSNNAAKKLNS